MGEPGCGKDTPGSFLLTVPCAGDMLWCSRRDSTLFGFEYTRMAQQPLGGWQPASRCCRGTQTRGKEQKMWEILPRVSEG